MLLPEAVIVERRSVTKDGAGGSTETWATHLAAWPCRIYEKAGQVRVGEAGEARVYTHRAIGEPADVQDGDRLVWLGRTYSIVRAYAVKAATAVHHLALFLNEL